MSDFITTAASYLLGAARDDRAHFTDQAAKLWSELPRQAAQSWENEALQEQLNRFAALECGAGTYPVTGSLDRYAARDAAWLNAALAAQHAPLLASALVGAVMTGAGEGEGQDSRDVGAVAFGLAVDRRLKAASANGLLARGHNAVALIGTLAVTAALADRLSLDPAQSRNALGVAGSLASGSSKLRPDISWIQAAWMARSAVLATHLARLAFVGPAEVLEGRKGFFNAYAGPGQASLSVLTEHLEATGAGRG